MNNKKDQFFNKFKPDSNFKSPLHSIASFIIPLHPIKGYYIEINSLKIYENENPKLFNMAKEILKLSQDLNI